MASTLRTIHAARPPQPSDPDGVTDPGAPPEAALDQALGALSAPVKVKPVKKPNQTVPYVAPVLVNAPKPAPESVIPPVVPADEPSLPAGLPKPVRRWPVLGVIAFGAICALFVGLWSPGQKVVTEKVSASVVVPPLPASAVPVPVAPVASSVAEEVVPAPPLPSASVLRPRAPVRATEVKPRLPAAAASEREPPPKNDGPGSLI